MPVQVTHNNKGHFYRIAIDIAKEGSELWDLTPYVKGRVGDNRFGLQIVWFYQGRKLDVTNMTPFIRGNVGHYSFDELKNLQMAPDADVVTSHGDSNDCGPDGEATYYFPEQMFPKDGIFKGFIGLESNDGDKQRLTGVNIWFSVLPNVANMGKACDFYVDVLDKTVANFNEKIRQQGIQFDTVLNQELQKEKDLIQQKLDAASDAIDDDKATLEKLAASVGAIQAQIDAGNVITRVEYNQLASKISDTLSKMRLNPEAFSNEAALKAKYPGGNDQLNVTTDNGHLWIWDEGWKDCGQYQTAGLEQSVIDMIRYAFFDGNLIPDGRFTNQDRSVWPVTSDTQCTAITYFGQQWLQITATGNQANRGVGWNVAKLTDDLFDNQAIINFKIRSSISERLSLNLQYARSDGSVIATQSISDVNLSAYTLIDFKRTISFNRSLASDTATVKLMLTKDDTSDLGTIMITDVSMKLIGVPDSATKDGNLISSGEQDNGLPSSWKYTSDTVLGVSHYLNRDWIQVTANGNSQYRGVGWTLKNNQYNDVLTYLLRIKMDIWSSIAQQLALNVAYVDKQGNTIATDSISDVSLAITSITQVDRYFKLQAPDPSNVDHVNLNLVTNGTADIGTILVSNVSVTIADKQSDNGNLVATSANGVAQGWGFTSNTVLQPVFRLGKYWLQITADGNNKYRGASWAITKDPAGEVFNYPLKVEFNIESSVTQDLALNVQLAKADGTLLQTDSIAGVELTAGRIQHQTYLVNLNYDNPTEVSQINLELLTNGTSDIGTILVSDLSVTPVYDKELDKKDSNDLQDSRAGLPVMNLKGSLNGISGDKYVPLQFTFKDGSRTVSGYASTKWQGQSSISMPKKAYRIKTFSDDGLSKKLKFKPCAEWEADNKWNLKAYYTDPLIGRDATNAKIGGAIWATERSLPQQLVETNNFGFVDGFPILLYINGGFAGVYSFNIAKGDYGEDATVISGTAYSDTTQYKSVPADGVKLDGSDFEMISPDTATDGIKKSVNDLLTFIATSSDTDFKAHFDEHLDKTSVIDYLIFSNLIDNSDAWGKNQTLITFDNQKWFFHPYDLDVSFGGEWNGTIRKLPTAVTTGGNRLFDRVSSLFLNDIKSRYTSLRSWLTPAYVINQYHNLVSSVGEDNYEQEYALWNNPNFEQNDFNFVKSRIMTQFKLCDKAWLN